MSTETAGAGNCPKCGAEILEPQNSTFKAWECESVLSLTTIRYIQQAGRFTQSGVCRIRSLELHRDKLREACEAAKREIEITIEDAAASQLNGFAVTINSGPRLLLSEILSKLRAALAITAPSPPAETATP